MTLAFLFGTNTVMCIFLPMAASRGVRDVTTALRAIRISAVFFVGSCLITLYTHDTVGWVTPRRSAARATDPSDAATWTLSPGRRNAAAAARGSLTLSEAPPAVSTS